LSEVLQIEQPIARPTVAAEWAVARLWQTGVLCALVLWLYLPTLSHLVVQWWQDPNYSHGFFVPLFSLFVLWQERARLSAVKAQPSWSGLLLLGFGLCVLILGQMGAEIFLSRVSLLIVLAGLLVLFLGWNFFRAVLFPWGFLLLMIPIPEIVFGQITFPLQILASKVASDILPWLGVPVLREGNVIILPLMPLEVADACSGIRSLMSLTTLAVIYGYLMESRVWLRVLLALASVPIAIATNSLRIVGTGLLVQYWDPEAGQGFFHEFQGWLMFVASLALLYFLHAAIRTVWPARRIDSRKRAGR
jgi:exosortase